METTPASIETELREVIKQIRMGVTALNEAETRAVRLNDEADRIEWRSYISNQGTIKDREALAKLEAADARLAADIARAEVNRVKAKIRALETESMAISVMAKQVAIEWQKG
jgi:hypothetical protein